MPKGKNGQDVNAAFGVSGDVFQSFRKVVGELNEKFKDPAKVLEKLAEHLGQKPNPTRIEQRNIQNIVKGVIDEHVKGLSKAEKEKYLQSVMVGLANPDLVPDTEGAQNVAAGIRNHVANHYAALHPAAPAARDHEEEGLVVEGDAAEQRVAEGRGRKSGKLNDARVLNLQIKLAGGVAAAAPAVVPVAPVERLEGEEPHAHEGDDVLAAAIKEEEGEHIDLRLPGVAEINDVDAQFLAKMARRLNDPEGELPDYLALAKNAEVEVLVLMPKDIAFSLLDPANPLATIDSETIDWMIKNVGANVFPMQGYYGETKTWEAICRFCGISPDRILALTRDGNHEQAFALVDKHVVYKASVPLSHLNLQFKAGNNFISTQKEIEQFHVEAWSQLFPQPDYLFNPDFGLAADAGAYVPAPFVPEEDRKQEPMEGEFVYAVPEEEEEEGNPDDQADQVVHEPAAQGHNYRGPSLRDPAAQRQRFNFGIQRPSDQAPTPVVPVSKILYDMVAEANAVCQKQGWTKEKTYAQEIFEECQGTDLSDQAVRQVICKHFKIDTAHKWSENSAKGLIAWHANKLLDVPFEGIRNKCRWKGKKNIPLLCEALENKFPSAPAVQLAYR